MKVTGDATLNAPVEVVWTALHDPAVLTRSIPGCERLDVTGSGVGRLTITTALAAVGGTYTGDVCIAEQQAPGFLALRGSGAGGTSTVSADVTVRLASAAEGGTLASYQVDAVVGGAIAGVGQRMLASIAKRLAGEFFAAVEGLLASVEAAGPASPATYPVGSGAGLAAESGADLDQPRGGTGVRGGTGPDFDQRRDGGGLSGGSGVRAGLLAGGAVGLAGILIGAVLGRRGRASGRRHH